MVDVQWTNWEMGDVDIVVSDYNPLCDRKWGWRRILQIDLTCVWESDV